MQDAAKVSEWCGRRAPPFALRDQDGRLHRLSDYRGRYVVLYWYPKDDTPGCTKEACGFRDGLREFEKLGAAVLGASILDCASKKKFADKHGVNFPLLADADHAAAQRYGVWKEKSLYGRKFMGVSRETFIIDPRGRIAMHWPKAGGAAQHAREVLEWLSLLMREATGDAPATPSTRAGHY